jgi:hypothetical protein
MENYSKNCKEVTVMRICMFFCLVLLGTAGCCGPTTLESDYGKSWAYNEAVQIANPDAALVQTPATGMSPNASTTVMNAYNKSFAGSKSGGGSSTTINLGGLTTAGGGGGSGN